MRRRVSTRARAAITREAYAAHWRHREDTTTITHEDIARLRAEYLAAGGEVHRVPPGASGEDAGGRR